jgi:hypothetical protein
MRVLNSGKRGDSPDLGSDGEPSIQLRKNLGLAGDLLGWETLARMDIVVAIVLVLVVLLPAVLVGGLFVWAALKDGQEDRALQARLGIRRRTRLGR